MPEHKGPDGKIRQVTQEEFDREDDAGAIPAAERRRRSVPGIRVEPMIDERGQPVPQEQPRKRQENSQNAQTEPVGGPQTVARAAVDKEPWELPEASAAPGIQAEAGDLDPVTGTPMRPLGTNPKDLIGVTKVPLRLIPPPALAFMAQVMALGAKKYGPYNWRRNKVKLSIYLEAAQRHILSKQDGEDLDPESGQPHEAHAMSCMAIILDAMATGNLVDDRETHGCFGNLVQKMQVKK